MKKQIVRGLIAAVLSMSGVHPVEYSQKNFLMPRAVLVNKSMEHTSWHAHIYKVTHNKRNLFSHFQLTPFFQHSVNRDETGTYFGIADCSTICNQKTCRNKFTIGDPDDATNPADIDGAKMVRVLTPSVKRFTGTVEFNPDQEVWGMRFDYLQYVHTPIEGLFMKLSVPMAHVATNMNRFQKCKDRSDEDCVRFVEPSGDTFDLTDYFAGNVEIIKDSAYLRAPLTHAKIDGRRTASGFADLDVTLGYRYCHTEKRHLLFNMLVTVPTGNRVRGEYLFEPIYGNGKHYGLGVGMDGGMQLWQGEQGEVWMDAGLQYKYLFENTEARTLGIKGTKFGHYFLMSAVHPDTNPQPFFPAANLLTRDLRVKPGAQLEALAHLSFQSRRLVADIGYNFYWRDRESVWVKQWTDNTYGVLSGVANNGAALNTNAVISTDHFVDNKYVNRENLDSDAVRTPAQITHKMHGGVAYRGVISNDFPASVAVGASYEFAQDNSALEQYAVWLKAGFSA